MKLSTTQILLYIIFISCVIIISYYYKRNNYNEPFNTNDNDNDDNNDDDLTLNELKLDNDLEKMDIKDIETKAKIISYLTDLQKMLKPIENIDVPISINNNGDVCESWNMYANGKYKNDDNNCIKINNSKIRKCLSNSILTSCSKYYNDGEIDNMLKIDTKEIIDTVKYNTLVELKTNESEIAKYNDDVDNVLNDLISKKNLENQQLYFIDYNNNNLSDKKNLFDKTNKEFEKAENNVNINKIQFQEFLEKKETISNQSDTYYYYIKWLIILLFIVGLCNFMFTELL